MPVVVSSEMPWFDMNLLVSQMEVQTGREEKRQEFKHSLVFINICQLLPLTLQ